MTEKELFRIMSDIDDRYVEEAAPETAEKEDGFKTISFEDEPGERKRTSGRRRKRQGRKIYWYGFASGVAAMLVLTIGLSVARLQIKNTQDAEKAEKSEIPQVELQIPDGNEADREQDVIMQAEEAQAPELDEAEEAQAPELDEAEEAQAPELDEAEEAQVPEGEDALREQAGEVQAPEGENTLQEQALEAKSGAQDSGVQLENHQYSYSNEAKEEYLTVPDNAEANGEASKEKENKQDRDRPVLISDIEQTETEADLFKDGSPVPENGYILPGSLDTVLTEADIENLTEKGIEYAVNEIWARYGRAFQSEELRNYFSAQNWYSPQYNADGTDDEKILSQMSEAAKQNIEYLNAVWAEQEGIR